MDLTDLRGLAYRCLEDCGFCCTFTPEVTSEELARLRTKFPALPVVTDEDTDRRHIAFQGGCGACTLLSNRACTAYEQRPAHCRYFPFHVHFGRMATALVNRCCRGVETALGSSVEAAFQADMASDVKPHDLRELAEAGASVFTQFDANCKEAGVRGDIAAAGRDAARDLSWPALRKLADRVGVPFEAMWESTLEPLGFEDVVERPFYLAKDLKWLTFRAAGAEVEVLEMDETGSVRVVQRIPRPKPSSGLPAEALRRVVSFFVERAPFEGQVAWIVDDTDYQIPCVDAAHLRVLELAFEAQWRAQVLWRLGVPDAELECEVIRFLDGAYLDAATIAGWL